MRLEINTSATVLSGRGQILKTDRFIKATAKFAEVDFFLSKLGGAFLLYADKFCGTKGNDIFKAEIQEHSIFFKVGCNEAEDIVFFEYLDKNGSDLINDQRLKKLCENNFMAEIGRVENSKIEIKLNKLYRLSNSDNVNFPYLSKEQQSLVMTEDDNVIVQGVAGSGKTNICIEKIVFTASREYLGKVLYSTYSRGLLIDTQKRINLIVNNLNSFLSDYKQGRIIFVDNDRKRAIENKLGIYFAEATVKEICIKIEKIIDFLQNKVDFFLIEDLYKKVTGKKEIKIAGEKFFTDSYIKNIKDHQLTGKLNKIKYLSAEVIYKEIYGALSGYYNPEKNGRELTVKEYTEMRADSFTASECAIIYSLYKDYLSFLEKNNLLDNNIMSRSLLCSADLPKYSLTILDEVQDMTEINLYLIKIISIKMFCVGDALQMINPSYFSFTYLKNLLYEKNIINVSKLVNNYRNTEKISEVIESLSKVNTAKFGVHNFVIEGKGMESGIDTDAVFVKDEAIIEDMAKQNYDSITIVVSGVKTKEKLRKILPNQEILTVSEIKGLERDIVVLYDIISDNREKWDALERTIISRKQAKENSVFRYYFNLFYVGLSRAKAHLYVVEGFQTPILYNFFSDNFTLLNRTDAIDKLNKVASKLLIGQVEMIKRTSQFLLLGQYDNARQTANKIIDALERQQYLDRIDVYENYVSGGEYRNAGIRFWELNMYNDAEEMFGLSGDDALTELMYACKKGTGEGLNVSIVKFLPEVYENDDAVKLIIGTLKKDLNSFKTEQKEITRKLKGKEK